MNTRRAIEIRKAAQGDELVLSLPPPASTGYRRRLQGRRGPIGVIVRDIEDGRQVVVFQSSGVLRYLDKLEAETGKET